MHVGAMFRYTYSNARLGIDMCVCMCLFVCVHVSCYEMLVRDNERFSPGQTEGVCPLVICTRTMATVCGPCKGPSLWSFANK